MDKDKERTTTMGITKGNEVKNKWEDMLTHLLVCAYEIASDKKNLTDNEYNEIMEDGDVPISLSFIEDAITNRDGANKFKKFIEDLSQEGYESKWDK